MAEFEDIRTVTGLASGDRYSDEIDAGMDGDPSAKPPHPLETDEAHKTLRQLLSWYYHERDKQSANRLDMAMDADFYDNLQWDENDAQDLRARGQMPLVYNEIAPMVDWIIGTERRMRVDWSVLPRTEDDVQAADVKTKVLKYVSDINRVGFARSRAFADAIKCGVGWMDDGSRDDPTQDALYSKYEDWRNVLYDSASYELDLSDARYLFRWRWVDEDVAMAMFPDRKDKVREAVENADGFDTEDLGDVWFMGEKLEPTGRLNGMGSASMLDTQRRRVKLYECQYRMPAMSKIVDDGPMKGAFLNEGDNVLAQHVQANGSTIVDRMVMRVHFAVFTEAALLSMGPSPYRHNRFSLTPVWCYRRGRDRLPYGVIRRVRDIQQDLNKRASKALFMLNTNQIIADEGAVADKNIARDEADRPDGYIEKKAGKEFTIRRDTDAATGQLQMMTLAAQSIQKTASVNNENLGRQTNAVSGAAIEKRQEQGAVGTTEPFDNQLFAVQVQGEKMLSLAEQFYTEEKVIRLTGAKNKIEWVRINQPEVQADGSTRYLNDITSSQADFVVAEQDYAGTLRQVMFDSLQQLVQKLPPEVGLKLFTLAMEFSDLPNHEDIANEIRRMTGDPDPNKELTPEEQAQQAQQAQAQAEMMQMQQEQSRLAVEQLAATVREINARADKIEAEARQIDGGGQDPELTQQLDGIRREASDQIQVLSEQLRQAQADLADRTMQINKEADTQLEKARIEADSRIRIAEIQQETDTRVAALQARLDALTTTEGATA
jgi:hypothetical protein